MLFSLAEAWLCPSKQIIQVVQAKFSVSDSANWWETCEGASQIIFFFGGGGMRKIYARSLRGAMLLSLPEQIDVNKNLDTKRPVHIPIDQPIMCIHESHQDDHCQPFI